MSILRQIQKRLSFSHRDQRHGMFIEKIDPKENQLLLNVGGTSELSEKYANAGNIIVCNISEQALEMAKGTKSLLVLGDGCSLPFKDKSIDVAFSNAVIEHVGDFEKQKKFASEIRRVAKNYFVATPNKWFPLELHYHLPFYQFVPKKIQRFLARHFTVGGHGKGYWIDLNLLCAGKLRELFPEADILEQKFFFLPAVLMACFRGK